jgi:hypothetical protein
MHFQTVSPRPKMNIINNSHLQNILPKIKSKKSQSWSKLKTEVIKEIEKNQDNGNSEKVTCGACPEEMGNESDLAELPFPLQLAVVVDSPFPVMTPWLSFRPLDSRMSRRASHTSTRK